VPDKNAPRVRRSITDLQTDYANGKKKPLEDLWRAWRGIKELAPDDPRSFFVIGGYHGEPFRGAGWGNAQYWGGYCMHGNILFPLWHRAYVLNLENALRSVPGCDDVTMPYWDETSDESLVKGVPWALTQESVELDGATIPNPLRSFVFPKPIKDFLSNPPDADYSKPQGYETVRYPLSGLYGPSDIDATNKHNALYPDYAVNVTLLNGNIVAWLTSVPIIDGKPISTPFINVKTRYEACLNAPNYTVFSNTTSAAQWNNDHDDKVIALESPHNAIHLAVGGVDIPAQNAAPIPGANGDMGENDTAALDPIFFFHHCFVDRVFWLWQQRHGFTQKLEVIPEYPGTNSVDAQGPTPGFAPNSWLTLETRLDPFKREDGTPYTSLDLIDIEQLDYSYGPGSLETPVAAAPSGPADVIHVSGVNRGSIRGSFLISAFANIGGQRQHIGSEAILSRWHVDGCANCQTHLHAEAFFEMPAPHVEAMLALSAAPEVNYEVEVRTRDGVLGSAPRPLALAASAVARPPFKVEIRRARDAVRA
jgi:tyrosinase